MATIDDNLAKAITEVLRQAQIDISNQDKLLAGPGDVTLSRPDGSSVTGPSWPKMSSAIGSAVQWRGNLPSTANLNTYGPDVSSMGAWSFGGPGAIIANGFPEDGARGIFEVFNGGPYLATQRFTNRTGIVYTRMLSGAWNGSNGPWSDWISTGLPLRGDLSTTDLNAITGENEGIHFQSRNGNATAARNYPVNIAGSLRVYKTAANNKKSCIQYYDAWDRDIAYRRTGVSDASGVVTWSAWSLVGTSAANKALNDLGLGLTAVQSLASFDWQQADLLSGAIYLVSSSNVTNMPPGITHNAGTGLYIIVRGNGASGFRNSIQVIPDTTANSNYREYEILSVGSKGSRSFNVRQIYTTADTIPISNGGTGATTAAVARTNLELGSAATYNANSVTTAASNLLMLEGTGGLWGYISPQGVNDGRYNERTGFYAAPGGAGVNYFDAYAPMMVMSRYQGVLGMLQISPTTGKAAVRGRNGDNFSAWNELYTTGNTTKASDGTLKAASPIVKVFSDGTSETNDESEGAVVIRQGEGVYLITGCIGLNSDPGWGGIDGGFDIPKDRNRQPLIWLDYEVNADGSVLVKTFHRTHPGSPVFARNEREGVAEGDPIDIPADQFVSVRVEMPVDSVWNQRQLEATEAMAEAERDIDREYVKLVPAAPEFDEEGNRCDKDDTLALDNNVIQMDTALALHHAIAKIEALTTQVTQLQAEVQALKA